MSTPKRPTRKLLKRQNRDLKKQLEALEIGADSQRQQLHDFVRRVHNGEIDAEVTNIPALEISSIEPLELATGSVSGILAGRLAGPDDVPLESVVSYLKKAVANKDDCTDELRATAAVLHVLANQTLQDIRHIDSPKERREAMAFYLRVVGMQNRTAETISNIRHPRTSHYVGHQQINQSQGHQQVNNPHADHTCSRVQADPRVVSDGRESDNQNPQNELEENTAHGISIHTGCLLYTSPSPRD